VGGGGGRHLLSPLNSCCYHAVYYSDRQGSPLPLLSTSVHHVTASSYYLLRGMRTHAALTAVRLEGTTGKLL